MKIDVKMTYKDKKKNIQFIIEGDENNVVGMMSKMGMMLMGQMGIIKPLTKERIKEMAA